MRVLGIWAHLPRRRDRRTDSPCVSGQGDIEALLRQLGHLERMNKGNPFFDRPILNSPYGYNIRNSTGSSMIRVTDSKER